MYTYQYSKVPCTDTNDVVENATKLAKDGWELVSVINEPDPIRPQYTLVAIYKKLKGT